jgi:dienelactone hydrolase
MEGGGRRWKVFAIGHPTQPPVLLLHEIPALSPGALKLAERLSDRFRVYVPLLFGRELDDNNNDVLRAWRPIEMSFFRPSWKALGNGERKITRDLSGLCRTIVKEHGKEARLAVIGMCITGNIPLQLAGEKDPIPQLKGVVLSQPTMPILTCNAEQKKSLGISDEELARAKTHVREADLRILGFRFEGDAVSPGERFTRLREEFGPRFIDGTLFKRDYIDADGMPKEAHAVLTDGYCKARKGPPHRSAGERAYAQLRSHLIDRLHPAE